MATALLKEADAFPFALSVYEEQMNDAIRQAHALRVTHLHQSISAYTKAQNLAIKLKVLSTWRHWVMASRHRHQKRARDKLPRALFDWQERSAIRRMKQEVFLAWRLLEKSVRAARRKRASGLRRLATRFLIRIKTRVFVDWKLVTRPAQQFLVNMNATSMDQEIRFSSSSFQPDARYGSPEQATSPPCSEKDYPVPGQQRPHDDHANDIDDLMLSHLSPTDRGLSESRIVERETEIDPSSASDDRARFHVCIDSTSPVAQPISFVSSSLSKQPTQQPEQVAIVSSLSSSSSPDESVTDYTLASSNSASLILGFGGQRQTKHSLGLLDSRNSSTSVQMFKMPAANPTVSNASVDEEYGRVGARCSANDTSVAWPDEQDPAGCAARIASEDAEYARVGARSSASDCRVARHKEQQRTGRELRIASADAEHAGVHGRLSANHSSVVRRVEQHPTRHAAHVASTGAEHACVGARSSPSKLSVVQQVEQHPTARAAHMASTRAEYACVAARSSPSRSSVARRYKQHPTVRAAQKVSADAEYGRVGARSTGDHFSVAKNAEQELRNYIVLRAPHRALTPLLVHYPPSPSTTHYGDQESSPCSVQFDATQMY